MQKLWKKLTFWIDQKPSKVSFLTRLIAYGLDWVIGGIIAGFPAVAIYGLVTGSSDMFSDLYVFPSLGFSVCWSYIAGFLCLLFAFLYLIYIPYKKYPGQTLGKRIMKIQIVRMDHKPLDIKTLFIRHIIGFMLLESVSVVVARYYRQMLTIATGIYFEYYLTAIGAFITMISTILVYNTPSRRAIHDYIANTTVVNIGDKAPKEKVQNRKNRHKNKRR